MALTGVDREHYNFVLEQLKTERQRAEAAEARNHELVKQLLDMKRHEFAMMPAGFDPTQADPWNAVGPKTQLAVEEASRGDPELERHNRYQALLLWKAHDSMKPDERDKAVADAIRKGDE